MSAGLKWAKQTGFPILAGRQIAVSGQDVETAAQGIGGNAVGAVVRVGVHGAIEPGFGGAAIVEFGADIDFVETAIRDDVLSREVRCYDEENKE